MLRSQRSEKGQAIIELVLVLPLVLVLIHVLIDFGLAVDRRTVLQQSLREASRHAAEGNETNAIAAVAVNESDGVLVPGDVTVCYINMGGGPGPGDEGDIVRVRLKHTYKFNVGSGELLGLFKVTPPEINLSPTAEAPLLHGATGTQSACP